MRRPRIKAVFPPIPAGDGRIRIGSGFGVACELQDDAQGHTWHLLGLLDGTRTHDQLVAAMKAFDPAVQPHEVQDAVDALADAGFIEDADASGPVDRFSTGELERYRRNLEFYGYFHRPPLTSADFQLRLKQARVTVLGLGGLGTHAAMSLAAIGVGDMLLVDHDEVELANLNRQLLYTDGDIGRPKVEAAAERIAQVNPHVRVTAQRSAVNGPEDAQRYMADRDLMICAADRPRVLLYRWLNTAALATGTPWIRGANDGLTVNMFLHIPHRTACYTCVEREAERTQPEYEPMQRYVMEAIGDRTVNPCTAPVAGMIGHLTALETVKYLTGIAEPAIAGRKLTLDLLHMDTAVAELKRIPDCPDCSGTGE
ncbi:HesA/MoeB/ThiF family protein [Streptomyces sp.]|uniref:HesA/MoeB/ThiF family protein n=1 Tax=Streptomyces sp. TaxID=1931 RepID=UPI002F3ED8FF